MICGTESSQISDNLIQKDVIKDLDLKQENYKPKGKLQGRSSSKTEKQTSIIEIEIIHSELYRV